MPDHQDAVLRLLDWLGPQLHQSGQHKKVAAVAAMIRLGIDPVTAGMPTDEEARAYRQLAETGWQGDPGKLAEIVGLVGSRIVLDDPENADDWAAVARMMQSGDALGWRARQSLRYMPTPELIGWFFDAGRGPGWAAAMVQRANDTGVRPDLIGFGAGVSPALFNEAVAAGLRTPGEVEALRDAGFSIEAAIRWLDEGHIAPGALIAARTTGLPEHTWPTMLRDLPGTWFPLVDQARERRIDPIRSGILRTSQEGTGVLRPPKVDTSSAGLTWHDLRTLADNGWATLTTYDLEWGFGKKRHRIRFTPQQIITLSAHVYSPALLSRWVEILLTGGSPRNDWRDPTLPALTWNRDPQPIIDLINADVSPAHIGTWRRAGCRTIPDILTALDSGIDVARANHLLATHGEKPTPRSTNRRFRTAAALHQAHAADAATEAAV